MRQALSQLRQELQQMQKLQPAELPGKAAPSSSKGWGLQGALGKENEAAPEIAVGAAAQLDSTTESLRALSRRAKQPRRSPLRSSADLSLRSVR
jgi:hypothetical protein